MNDEIHDLAEKLDSVSEALATLKKKKKDLADQKQITVVFRGKVIEQLKQETEELADLHDQKKKEECNELRSVDSVRDLVSRIEKKEKELAERIGKYSRLDEEWYFLAKVEKDWQGLIEDKDLSAFEDFREAIIRMPERFPKLCHQQLGSEKEGWCPALDCPIFDEVRNRKCKHSYSSVGIGLIIAKSTNRLCACPVVGCNNLSVEEEDIVPADGVQDLWTGKKCDAAGLRRKNTGTKLSTWPDERPATEVVNSKTNDSHPAFAPNDPVEFEHRRSSGVSTVRINAAPFGSGSKKHKKK